MLWIRLCRSLCIEKPIRGLGRRPSPRRESADRLTVELVDTSGNVEGTDEMETPPFRFPSMTESLTRTSPGRDDSNTLTNLTPSAAFPLTRRFSKVTEYQYAVS